MASRSGERIRLSREATERSRNIFTSFEEVRGILDRYEPMVRKRWMKKSTAQRKVALLEAWPGMAEGHHPHFKAYRRDTALQARRDAHHQHLGHTKFRDAYMWPSINLEDLQRGNTLLLLLNSRGRHLPYIFAHLDGGSVYLGAHWGVIASRTVDNFYMMDLAGDSAETYGRVEQNPRQTTSDEVDSTKMTVDMGMTVLEVQERILEFLKLICRLILRDQDLSDQTIPVVPEPPPLKGPEGEWLSLDSLARSAPYIVPEPNDLHLVKERLAARVDEFQDQLWSLREDPAFFADQVLEWSEHLGERLPDAKGRPHQGINDRSSGQRKFWDQVTHGVIYKAHEHCYHWRELDNQLAAIIAYQDDPNRSPQKTRNYHRAVLKMKILMEKEILPNLLGMMNIFISSSPGSRHHFQREDEPESYAGWGIGPRPNADIKGDDLMWLYLHLMIPDKCEEIGWELLAFEFEELIRDKAYRHRISPLLAWYFDMFGLLGLLRQQLRICFPRVFNMSGDIHHWDVDMSLHGWLERFLRPMQELNAVGITEESRFFLDLHGEGDPTSGKFFYPANKRRTQETTEAMQRAERNLDDLWAVFDAHVDRSPLYEAKVTMLRLLPQNKELLRTPDWVEPAKAPSKPDQLEHAPKSEVAPTTAFNSNNNENAPQPKFNSILPLRTKPKTRGAATPRQTDDVATAPTAEDRTQQQQQPPRFEVKARAYKVFSILFYTPNPHSQPGDVNWTDFLHAMNAIGFLPVKLYGSAWNFMPKAGQLDDHDMFGQQIIFHEPHPSSKLAFVVARRYGRRLTRKYGLCGESFVLKERT